MEKQANYNGFPSSDHYKEMTDFGKIVCVDFDGCIASFDGYKGNDIFGKVINRAQESLQHLANNGWYIIIFTTRLVTSSLIHWLRDEQIPFDDINGRIDSTGTIRMQTYIDRTSVDYAPLSEKHFWRHNPSHSSIKPIASVYVDDMSWENEGKNYTEETWKKLVESLDRRFNSGAKHGVSNKV